MRFYALLLCCNACLVIVGGWGVVSSRSTNAETSALLASLLSTTENVANFREATSNLIRWQLNAMAVGDRDPEQVKRLTDKWHQELKTVESASATIIETNRQHPELLALLDEQRKLLKEYAAIIGPVLQDLAEGRIDGILAFSYGSGALNVVAKLSKNTAAILDQQKALSLRQQEDLAAASSRASLQRLIIVALAIPIITPLVWFTLKSVCEPLDDAVSVADKISTGNLGQALRISGRDEATSLMLSLQRMQVALVQLVGEVKDSSESIGVSSSEVASANMDLSHRTEVTAANLQRTIGAMAELAGRVQSMAGSARAASGMATSAVQVAQRGGDLVSQAVGTMHDIQASSAKIADITSVIDSIAFQTNILALNAAVEAAQAGDHGRGFAVVAGEVRVLASRCAEAAKQIRTLIADSLDKVQGGSRLVSEAGATMQEIVHAVEQVCGSLSHVADSAAEQSDGLQQIQTSVLEVDRMTQQNAALVEQNSAAAEELKGQASRLCRVVDTFQLGEPDSVLSTGSASDAP